MKNRKIGLTDSMLILFPQSIWLEEEDAAREASKSYVIRHVNLSFPDLNAVFSFLTLIFRFICLHFLHGNFFLVFNITYLSINLKINMYYIINAMRIFFLRSKY